MIKLTITRSLNSQTTALIDLVIVTWDNPKPRTWSLRPNVLIACLKLLLQLLYLTFFTTASLFLLLLLLKPSCYFLFLSKLPILPNKLSHTGNNKQGELLTRERDKNTYLNVIIFQQRCGAVISQAVRDKEMGVHLVCLSSETVAGFILPLIQVCNLTLYM